MFTEEKTFIIDLHLPNLLIRVLLKVTTVEGNFCFYFLIFKIVVKYSIK